MVVVVLLNPLFYWRLESQGPFILLYTIYIYVLLNSEIVWVFWANCSLKKNCWKPTFFHQSNREKQHTIIGIIS